MPLPILLSREALSRLLHVSLRASIFASFHMTEEKFRGLMNVVMMSPDIFGCFKASATQLTLLRVDVRLFMAVVVAGERKCSVAIWELACDESGGGW